jgi:hypothetical protein
MGGFFQNLKNNLMQPITGTPMWSAQQRAQVEKQQQDREDQMEYQRQSAADIALAEHMNTDVRALPVVANTVKETMPTATSDNPYSPDVTVARPADPSRVVKHKTAEGDTVQWELPTPEAQVRRQIQLQAPALAAQNAQIGATAQSQARGTATGRTAGEIADREARGVPITPELAKLYNVPATTPNADGTTSPYKMLPEELSRAIPPTVRANASTENAGTRADTAKTVAQMKIDAAQALKDAQQQFQADQNDKKLAFQDQWAKARNAVTANTQGALSSRAALNRFDADQKLHGTLVDNAFNEQQKATSAQALIDTMETPGMLGFGTTTTPAIKDGEEFSDPWSGKKMTMNYAQRLRIKNAIGISQSKIADMQNRAEQLGSKYGVNGQPAAPATGAGGGTPGGAAPPQTPGAGGPASPAGAAPKGMVRVKTGDGRTGSIPAANLKKAQALDPKLQVLQ